MSTNPHVYGSALFPALPHMGIGAGLSTPYGVLLPPGTRVAAYVDSGGVSDLGDQTINAMTVSTLAAALKYCRANKGDTIIVLPGHAENVSDATMLDNLVAGTKIIGIGHGSDKPTFTWTNTAGQWTLDQANVIVSGLKFDMTGVDAVVKGIAITAADVTVTGCEFDVADSDAAAALIALEVGTGGARANLTGNLVHGEATAGITDGFLVAAAVAGVRIVGNEMLASASVANGLIRVSAAATELVVMNNIVANTETASTACIAFGNVACTGICAFNMMSTLNDGTAASQGVTFGAAALIRAFENYSSDEAVKSGVLAPAAVAT